MTIKTVRPRPVEVIEQVTKDIEGVISMNKSATDKPQGATRRTAAAAGITIMLLAAATIMTFAASPAVAARPSTLAENPRAHQKIVATETITGTAQPTGTAHNTSTATRTEVPQVTQTVVPGATGTVTKVSVCHATGSQTNPYVLTTISMNALPAHLQHGDLYPAPQGGCPAGTPKAQHTPQVKSNTQPAAAPRANKGTVGTKDKPKVVPKAAPRSNVNGTTNKGNSQSAAGKQGAVKEQEEQKAGKAAGNGNANSKSGKNGKP